MRSGSVVQKTCKKKKKSFFKKSGQLNYHFLHTIVTLNLMLAIHIEGKHLICISPVY